MQEFGRSWLRIGDPRRDPDAHPAGTVSWEEHLAAWEVYAKRYGREQSAERVAERCGFCWAELREFLGHAPTTWEPR